MAVALGLVAMRHIQNPLGRDWQGENQPIQNHIYRGAQGTVSLIHYKEVAGNTQVPLEGILNVQHGN